MDDLQLPKSPRASPKFHRSGNFDSLTTGRSRDLRDDLKLSAGAGVAMTMLASSSPRAAAVAKDFVLSNFLESEKLHSNSSSSNGGATLGSTGSPRASRVGFASSGVFGHGLGGREAAAAAAAGHGHGHGGLKRSASCAEIAAADVAANGRHSPRAATDVSAVGGGGLLQELNGVTQISPSGRTAHLGERLGPGAC